MKCPDNIPCLKCFDERLDALVLADTHTVGAAYAELGAEFFRRFEYYPYGNYDRFLKDRAKDLKALAKIMKKPASKRLQAYKVVFKPKY